jgi:hypothetical protein
LIAYTFEWRAVFQKCCEDHRTPNGNKECLPFDVATNVSGDGPLVAQTTLAAAAATNQVDAAVYSHAKKVFWKRVREAEAHSGVDFSGGIAKSQLQDPEVLAQPRRKHKDAQFLGQTVGSWSTTSHESALSIYESGVVIYAVGPGDTRKAFKSAASAKAVYGPGLRATLLTDCTGSQTVRRFRNAKVFDRVVNVLGNSRLFDEFSTRMSASSGKSVNAESVLWPLMRLIKVRS